MIYKFKWALQNLHSRICVLLTFVLQGLRYKDYHLVASPGLVETTPSKSGPPTMSPVKVPDVVDWSFEEVDTVKEFGKHMEGKGVMEWWRKAMDFTS